MKVHLVGSVGLPDAATVFRTVTEILEDRCTRIPDGETGARSGWVRWQTAHLARNPLLETVSTSEAIPGFIAADGVERSFFRISDRATSLTFGELGYAREALASWAVFSGLEAEGQLAGSPRFQVSLPSPVGLACAFFLPDDRPRAEAAFEVAMMQELATLQEHIPPSRLSIQWDAVFEVVGESFGQGLHYQPQFEGSVERLVRLIDAVDAVAEVGIHFCYGDAGAKHIVEPADLEIVVRFIGAINTHANRSLDFAHTPVPVARADDAYFAPLAALDPASATRIILGLVHDRDGVEGTRRRIATAHRHLGDFDIGTECGFGRRDPATIEALLTLHRDLCIRA
ncbi:MAG: hypothetical protein JWR80_1545 [Bradyrhizobium sp.]|nr:hypothetical protein [Bradyrhizobium sp.]